MTGHEECVQMLLEKEVSILCRDARGRTPLHFAAARGHATWLSELLQVALSEEDCSLKDNQGYTPLHWASYNGKALLGYCPAQGWPQLWGNLVEELEMKRQIIPVCCLWLAFPTYTLQFRGQGNSSSTSQGLCSSFAPSHKKSG